MLVTANSVKSYHELLAKALGDHLPGGIEITSAREYQRLDQLRLGEKVTYTAIGAAASFPEFADRKRGGRVAVLRLMPEAPFDAPCAWFGWFERWRKANANRHQLESVSATFFWGFQGRPDKQQLLRAEWDCEEVAAQKSAQPHWQFDSTYEWIYESRSVQQRRTPPIEEPVELIEVIEDAPLVEVGAMFAQELSVSGMHLGMAGWENAQQADRWWRLGMPHQPTTLVRWAERTLRHVAEQFSWFSAKQIL